MKSMKKISAVLLVIAVIFSCFSMSFTAFAADTTLKTLKLLGTRSGYIVENRSKSFSFNVPISSTVYATFTGKDTLNKGDGSFTPYKVKVTIKDSDNSVVKSTTVTIDNKTRTDKRVFADLKKGDYKIIIKSALDVPETFYNVTVYEKLTKEYPTTSLKLNRSSITVKYDNEDNIPVLKATQAPFYTTDDLTWSTSNKNVATVKNGRITPVNLGTATITAKSGTKTAKCTVNIKSLSFHALTGSSTYLKKYVKYIKNYEGGTWYTSDKKIATVSSSGKFTPKQPGICTITYKTPDERYYKFLIYVTDPVAITDYNFYSSSNGEALVFQLTNLSEKKVNFVKIRLIEYDYNGNTINDTYRYFKDKNILSGNYSTLRCEIKPAAYTFQAYVTEIHFTDGSVWNK